LAKIWRELLSMMPIKKKPSQQELLLVTYMNTNTAPQPEKGTRKKNLNITVQNNWTIGTKESINELSLNKTGQSTTLHVPYSFYGGKP